MPTSSDSNSYTPASVIVNRYNDFDISLRRDNGVPAHSKISELRGVITPSRPS
jgi:hypothetical protein